MSEEPSPSPDDHSVQETSDKQNPIVASTAKEKFEKSLADIAALATDVNKERKKFLAGTPSTPDDLREKEKILFKAIKEASKPKKKGDFETLTVELSHKKWPVGSQTEVIYAVRGRSFYHETSDNIQPIVEQGEALEGEPIIPKYSSLSSSSSVSGYA